MLVVGELINASRKVIATAIDNQNAATIKKIAADQCSAGANYIDVNAGVFVDEETEYLKWLVTHVQKSVDLPCCIDSPSPSAIEAALYIHKGNAMINSISLETERMNALLPIVSGTDFKIVALCMSDEGMPETTQARVQIAEKLINKLIQYNVSIDNIYVDPLVQPISTNDRFGIEFLNAIETIMTQFEGVHTICGMSNISFGMPVRKLINRVFAIMAVTKGLDGIIANPLDKNMMASLIAAETLVGNDSFCRNYLSAYRSNKIDLTNI